MKASVGFIFFMLFLAGLAFVNLRELSDRSDALVESTAEIAATNWRPTHIGEMRIENDTPITLQFDSENGLSGYSGCNRFAGNFELVEATFAAGPMNSTRMACPEPANSFEFSYLQAIQATRSISRTDTRLVFHDNQGVAVARFVNADPGNASD
jgi:heat shock protein HslJ